MLAGVMYVLADILGDLAPQQRVFDSFSDYLQEVIFAVAVAGTLGAIAGLHALHSGRYVRLGAAGSLLAFIGYALFFVRTAVTILVGAQAPLYAVRLSYVGVLAVLIGSVLLGAMTLRARVLPWWCGVLLIVGFPLSLASAVAFSTAGGIVLGIVWGLIGYALLSLRGTVEEQPSHVS